MLTRKQLRTLSLSIFVSAVLYLAFIFSAETDKILTAMSSLSPLDWLLILSFSFLNYVFRFIRWQKYIHSFSHTIPLKLHFAYYLAGLALTTTPAKTGETLRSLYLLPHKVKLNQSLASFFTERLLDVVIMVFFASLLFFTLPELDKKYSIFTLTIFTALLFLLPFLSTRYPQIFLQTIITWLNKPKITTLLEHLITLLQSAHSLLKIKMLSQGLLLGFFAWFIHGFILYIILLKMGSQLDLSVILTIYAISILAGAASFIPGGIGATEAVMGLLLISVGSESHIAIAAPILTRVATLWFAVFIGLIANVYLSFKNKLPEQNNR